MREKRAEKCAGIMNRMLSLGGHIFVLCSKVCRKRLIMAEHKFSFANSILEIHKYLSLSHHYIKLSLLRNDAQVIVPIPKLMMTK